MKKIIFVLGIVFLCVSCESQFTEADIEGKWVYTHYQSINGNWLSYPKESWEIYHSDGRVELGPDDYTVGKYALKNDQVTVSYDLNGIREIYYNSILKIEGDTMYKKMEWENTTGSQQFIMVRK